MDCRINNFEYSGSRSRSRSIAVYPNPAKDEFTIAMHQSTGAQVEIYDMLGKMVYKEIINSNRTVISNEGRFKTGMYLIKVIDADLIVYHSKLLIQ